MKNIISAATISELSLIRAEHKGEKWAPVNPDALVLATKAEASSRVLIVGDVTHTIAKDAPPFVEPLLAKASDAMLVDFRLKGWLVNDDQPDTIDNDGDGAADYEGIAMLIYRASSDIGAAMSIGDYDESSARSAAIVATVDAFLKNLDDIRTGGEGDVAKAGAKHSADTKAALGKIKEHAAAIAGHVASMMPDEDDAEDAADGGEDDATEGKAAPLEAPVDPIKAEAEDASKAALAAIEERRTAVAAELEATNIALEKAKTDVAAAQVALKADNAAKASALAEATAAARAPQAPGGLGVVMGDGSIKASPVTHAEKGESRVLKACRAQLAQSGTTVI